jgi:hypothetical protein
MSKEQGEDQGFRVTDKRLFGEDGKTREDSAAEVRSDPETAKVPGSKPPTAAAEEAPPGTGGQIDFPSYVLSYYTQSLVLLGEVPNPYTNKKEEDLEAARHTVDILDMLKDKTRGNLSADEAQLLDSVLYEVRLKYMAKTKKIKLS